MKTPRFGLCKSLLPFLHPLFLQLMALNTICMLIPKFPFQTSCRSPVYYMSNSHFICHKFQIKLGYLVCKPATLPFYLLSLKQRCSWLFSSLPCTSDSSMSPEDSFFKIYPESTSSQKLFSHHCCLVQTIVSPLDWVILSLLLTLSSILSTTQQLGDPFEMSDQANSAPNITKPSSYSVKTKVKVSGNFLNLPPTTLFLDSLFVADWIFQRQALETELVVVVFSCKVVSNFLWLLELQHAKLPCPSLSSRACSDSCLLS